jgi:uncharacterized repeat protein (TIGR01451 family)
MRATKYLPRAGAGLLLGATLTACTGDQNPQIAAPTGAVLTTAIFQKPTKTVEGYWNRGLTYDWSVVKTVSPSTQEIGPGTTAALSYTVAATRTPVDSASQAGVRGQICVKNTGSQDSQGMTVRDVVQARINNVWTTVAVTNVDVSSNPVVSPGETACFDYDVPLTPVVGREYQNQGEVTWTNAGNGGTGGNTQTWETAWMPFTLPATPNTTETDATAALADVLTCPAGFSCTPLTGSWSLTGTQTLQYAVQVTNVSAPCGHGASVVNTVTLTEGDSRTPRTSGATSGVTTPECAPALRISKVADVAMEEAGNPIGFAITVTSDGPGTARNVTLTDPLPTGAGISWTESSADCTIANNTLSCSFGDMAAGATRTVQITSPTTAQSCAVYPNTASAQATNHDPVTASASITVKCTPPPVGIHGCTPGYWKQTQHFGSWVGYVPTGPSASRYNTVFGVNLFSSSTTLLQALGQGGGGANRFGRHSTAALLNSANSGVQFGMTTAQVIAAVQAAVASGNLDTLSDQFERMNERGCPLGRAE